MVVSLPFAWVYLLPISLIEFSESVLYSITFISNFYFNFSGQEYGAESGLLKPFLHTWSLSVEEQYYIIFPILLFITLKYFQKKYTFEVKILSDENFVIPEYKINLLNKSKKIISTVENINPIIQVNKLKNIKIELDALVEQSNKLILKDDEILRKNIQKLQDINEELWDIENAKRECEANKEFGETFIKISRDVHFKNDIRASIKKEINLLSNSKITEEKEYSKY